jgi:hypothetical protein
MTILTSILQSILNAASYNKHQLAVPRVILWPDEDRLWTQCIEPLRESYPASGPWDTILPTKQPVQRPGFGRSVSGLDI